MTGNIGNRKGVGGRVEKEGTGKTFVEKSFPIPFQKTLMEKISQLPT